MNCANCKSAIRTIKVKRINRYAVCSKCYKAFVKIQQGITFDGLQVPKDKQWWNFE